ncbi:hypothetical protein X975_22616, partial [Stegodyphus mimosarum]
MREVCTHSPLRHDSKQIGSLNKIVEIDESLFTKRKNQVGCILGYLRDSAERSTNVSLSRFPIKIQQL